MTTLEEVFLHLETERDAAEGGDIPPNVSHNVPADISQPASSGGSEMDNDEDDDDDDNDERDALPKSATPPAVASAVADNHATKMKKAKKQPLTWSELDALPLRPHAWRTLGAMLRLRCVIMMRDLQRLYLMIALPLGFTAIGLYLNSIQVRHRGRDQATNAVIDCLSITRSFCPSCNRLA